MGNIKQSILAGIFSILTIGILTFLTYKTDFGVFLLASFNFALLLVAIVFVEVPAVLVNVKDVWLIITSTILVSVVPESFVNELNHLFLIHY